MAEISGVKDQIWLDGQRVDLADRHLQRGSNIDICRLIETDVTVADLDKRKRRLIARFRVCAKKARYRHASSERPYHSRAGPCHALEEAASIDAITAWSLS